jgi:hypothetical protein
MWAGAPEGLERGAEAGDVRCVSAQGSHELNIVPTDSR